MAPRHKLTPVGRVAYPNLAAARQRNETAKPRFSVTLVFDESVNLTPMKKAVMAVCKEKYPNGLPSGFRNPFRSGEDKRREDGSLPDGFKATDTFIEAWKYEEHGKIPCVDAQRNTLVASDIYAGMTARIAYRAFCYSVDGNKGVSLGLEAFQKHEDGTPIGAAPADPQTEFDDLETRDPPPADVEDLPF